MSFGLQVFDAAGATIMDMQSTVARLIGTGTVSFAAGETGTKNIAIPGLLDTDKIIIRARSQSFTNYTTSITAGNLAITRALLGLAVQNLNASSHYILAFRTQ